MRILALLVLLLSTPARAEVENPNLLPLGEEEAFLGNAGIAHNESTGATYYNPGALGFIRDKKISVYGNAYMGDHTYIRSETRLNGYDVPLNSSTFTPVPLSSVTIFGNPRYTYAFSVHVPYSASYEFQMPLHTDTANLALIGNASASTLWIGPSVGKRVSDSFGWGFSVYALRYSQSSVILDNVTANVGSNAVLGTLGAAQTLKAWAALAIVGAQWQVSPDWRLGARMQTQSVDLRGKGSYYSVGSGTVNSQSFNNLTNESDFAARYRVPFQAGFGVETTAVRNLELLGDLNLQFPLDYGTSPSRPAFSTRVITKFTPRGNLGLKWRFDVNRSLLAGALYNPSTVPRGSSSLSSFTAESFKGVTFGYQFDAGVLVTSLGGFFLWSTGEFQVENTNGNVQSPMEHQIYGALVTASYKL